MALNTMVTWYEVQTTSPCTKVRLLHSLHVLQDKISTSQRFVLALVAFAALQAKKEPLRSTRDAQFEYRQHLAQLPVKKKTLKGPSDEAAFILLLVMEEFLQLRCLSYEEYRNRHKIPTLASANNFRGTFASIEFKWWVIPLNADCFTFTAQSYLPAYLYLIFVRKWGVV